MSSEHLLPIVSTITYIDLFCHLTIRVWKCVYGYLYIVDYRDRLFMSLEEAITIGNPVNFELHNAPTLASKGEQATKEEVIQRQSSRGLKLKPQFVRTNDIVEEGKRKSRKLNK